MASKYETTTVGDLRRLLHKLPGNREVLFCLDDPELDAFDTCLGISGATEETAHDDDCTPFVRIGLAATGGPSVTADDAGGPTP